MKNFSTIIIGGIIAMIATNVGAEECNSPHYRKFTQNLSTVFTKICVEDGTEVEYRCDNNERYEWVAWEYDSEEVLSCYGGAITSPNPYNGGTTVVTSNGGRIIINLNDSNASQNPWDTTLTITSDMRAEAYSDYQQIQPANTGASGVGIFDLNSQNIGTFDAFKFVSDLPSGDPIYYSADPFIRWGLADSNSVAQFCDINADQGFCNATSASILPVTIDSELLDWADILQNPSSANSTNYINTVVRQLPRNIGRNEGKAIALDLAARQLFLDILAEQIQGQGQ